MGNTYSFDCSGTSISADAIVGKRMVEATAVEAVWRN